MQSIQSDDSADDAPLAKNAQVCMESDRRDTNVTREIKEMLVEHLDAVKKEREEGREEIREILQEQQRKYEQLRLDYDR